MLAILIRVGLLLAPLLALFLWLRWRARKKKNAESVEGDARKLLMQLGVIAVVFIILAGLLYVTDEKRAPADRVYVPPRMENGKLIPGHFVDKNESQNLDAEDQDKSGKKGDEKEDQDGP